jgi:DNA-binding SARP family transcriptional activator
MPDDKESLQKAVDLYCGYYYENESIQEWLSAAAQYFHQRFTSAAEKLIDIYMAEDDFENALSLTQELLKRDPCWEPAYRKQMCIYHRLGNRSMVQLTFEQCQQILQQQLNSDVSEETRDLSIALLHTKA